MPMKPFSHRTLSTQLAIVFGALACTVAVVLSLGFGELLRVRIRAAEEAALDVLAHSVAQQLEAQLRNRSDQVVPLANSSSLWEKGIDGAPVSGDGVHAAVQLALPADAQASGRSVFIFDRAGALVYAPTGNVDLLRGSGLVMPELKARSGERARADVVRWNDGANYLTALVPLQAQSAATDLGWRIVVREPALLADAAVRNAAGIALAIGITLTVLAAWAAWTAARGLSRDLRGIAAAAAQVQAGKPGTAMPLFNGNQEVEALSTSLQKMTQQLIDANASMEEQVRLRTAELLAANHQLDLQARSDPLTGLPNRRAFDEHVHAALAATQRNGRPLALVMVDVDHFKRVNDRFGHDVGDSVLCTIARLFGRRLRAIDTAARVGGEEFALLLPETDAAGARVVAQSIVDSMGRAHDSVFGSVTVSAGVAVVLGGNATADQLMRRADEALYRAKALGRDRVCMEVSLVLGVVAPTASAG